MIWRRVDYLLPLASSTLRMFQSGGRVDDPVVDFAAMDRYFGGGYKAQFHAVAVDLQYDDLDILANLDGLIRFA